MLNDTTFNNTFLSIFETWEKKVPVKKSNNNNNYQHFCLASCCPLEDLRGNIKKTTVKPR